MPISYWNALKGGGDTATKLMDNCQERVGIRTETTMASARLLLYFGIVFHQVNQWCYAKQDLDFYPTIAHARDANNKRATFADSLVLLFEMFLSQARNSASTVDGLDGDDGLTLEMNQVLSVGDSEEEEKDEELPRKRATRRSVAATPKPVQFEVAGFKTGKTPVERENDGGDNFKLRCDLCIGVYYGKLVPDPDLKKVLKDQRIRRMCFHCGTRTNYFCFGCRRFLCFAPPKLERKDEHGNKIKLPKQPKYFAVKMPVLNKQGELQIIQRDDKEEYKFEKEVGQWTCYHAAHQRGWKTHLQLNQSNILEATRGKRTRRRSF
jgi:hypothetical protein